jgi:hypothetical protein
MARELGGRGLAQIFAALAVALSRLPLFEGTEFQYSSFDYLWWVLIAYFIIRLLELRQSPLVACHRSTSSELGLETKYSIVFFIAGILGGLALTPARRQFAHSAGSGPEFAWLFSSFLPNLIWLVPPRLHLLHTSSSTSISAMSARAAPITFPQRPDLAFASTSSPRQWIAGLISSCATAASAPSPGCT